MAQFNEKKRRRFKVRGGVRKKQNRERVERKESGEGLRQDNQHRNHWRSNQPNVIDHRTVSKTLTLTGEEPTTLDRDLHSYLVKVHNTLNSLSIQPTLDGSNLSTTVDEDDEELPSAVLLAQNAVSELISRLHDVAMDPSGSKIFQSLVWHVRDPEIIANTMKSIVALGSSRFVSFIEHRCASHVLQDVIKKLSMVSPSIIFVHDSVIGLAQSLETWDAHQLFNTMCAPSGSHVLRSVFGLLAGIPPEEPRTAKLDDSSPVPISAYYEITKVETPVEWHNAIIHFANLIIAAPDKAQNLPWATASSSALQGLISACTCVNRALSKKLVKVVMGDQLSELVFDSCGSRFVERVVTCLGAGVVWEKVKGHLTEMVCHPKANHVAQRVFLRLSGRAQVKTVWDEVEHKVADCLRFGSAREGIVLALVRAAEAEGGDVLQRRAAKCISRALGTTGENSKCYVGAILTGCLHEWKRWQSEISHSNYSVLGVNGEDCDVLRLCTKSLRFNTVNVLIARSLLRFSGAAGQTARDSMNSLTNLEILALIADTAGSRLIEQWIELDIRNSERIAQTFLGSAHCVVFATAKSACGAMVLSKCIPNLGPYSQKRIMDILASKVQSLKEDRFGSIAVRKCRLELYMRNPEQWRDSSTAQATRARLFDDLFQCEFQKGSGTSSKRKKGGVQIGTNPIN